MNSIPPVTFTLPEQPTRVILESQADYSAAITQLTAVATRSIYLFDRDWQVPIYESRGWMAQLADWLRANSQRRLVIVLRDIDYASRYGDRLKHLLKQFCDQIEIRQAESAALRLSECWMLVDDAHFVRKGESRHPRGALNWHDATGAQTLNRRWIELIAASVVAIPATTLGL